MNAKELRIGNVVKYKGALLTVHELHPDYIVPFKTFRSQIPPHKIEPIPLSPSILEKCGFVKFETHKEMSIDVTHNSSLTYFYGNSKDYIAIETLPADEHEPGSVNYVVLDIQYLHQLQNLFYSLSQTELNIKL